MVDERVVLAEEGIEDNLHVFVFVLLAKSKLQFFVDELLKELFESLALFVQGAKELVVHHHFLKLLVPGHPYFVNDIFANKVRDLCKH